MFNPFCLFKINKLVKSQIEWQSKKLQIQGAQFACLVARTGKDSFFLLRTNTCLSAVVGCVPRALRNEAYLLYAAVTKDAAERRSWTFYKAIKIKAL